ncbi:MAG: hypothetical protein IH861_04185 [Chloroflexi bacterium]|nr:hypothetical protein [Chloroflexota bacterium]
MTQDQTQTNASDEGEEEGPPPEYLIEVAQADQESRAIALVIASRRCYEDQKADDAPPTGSSDPKVYIKRIVSHCAATEDYLLPDTPLKDAIFRVMLAGGNVPTTPESISEILSEKWAMTAYPRDVSPKVIQRLLDNSQAYGIFKISDPEAEEPEEEEVVAVEESTQVEEEAMAEGDEVETVENE